MRNDLCIVLTIRMASTRLPGKVLALVEGKPLAYWIVRRLQNAGQVVIATTDEPDDLPIVALGQAMNVPVYCGEHDDVVGRIDNAMKKFYPTAQYVLRGLGDCPFHAPELIMRACQVLKVYDKDAVVWALAPYVLPVYGSRELPFARTAWDLIARESQDREHPDIFFHTHRERFDVLYHEPPPSTYFRTYRLEVDWPEDLELIRVIAKHLPPLDKVTIPNVNKWLSQHEKLILNRDRVEITGPSRYDYEVQRQWLKLMQNQPVVRWDGSVWQPPSKDAIPIFCSGGRCLLGFGDHGILHTKEAKIAGNAWIKCACGCGLRWTARK